MNNAKNIVVLKNLPSNLVEEAIIIVKGKITEKNTNILKYKNDVVISSINEEDFKKIERIPKDSRNYVVKEAEMVINNYLEEIDNDKKKNVSSKIIQKYNRLRYLNLVLLVISILSTTICIIN